MGCFICIVGLVTGQLFLLEINGGFGVHRVDYRLVLANAVIVKLYSRYCENYENLRT